MATHTFSTHRLVQRLLPGMRSRERSDVVLISSSELNRMKALGAPYNMAKAALEALGLTLANEEVANGVHVNIVAPGLVVTDMGAKLVKAKLGLENMEELDATQPLGRLVHPGDIASVVRFLCSPAAGFLTGQRIVVDGGVDASPTG
jgi:3-oxoacyl-[acyl-carrier protein] reductase